MGLVPLQCDRSVLVMLQAASALFTKSQLYIRRACAHGQPLGLVAQPYQSATNAMIVVSAAFQSAVLV